MFEGLAFVRNLVLVSKGTDIWVIYLKGDGLDYSAVQNVCLHYYNFFKSVCIGSA